MVNTWVFFADGQIFGIDTFTSELKKLLSQWDSHGELVPNNFEVIENQIIIIDAKPGATSGCSIDALHKIVDALLKQYGCTLLASSEVVYRENGKIVHVDFRKIPELLRSGLISSDTIVFDVQSRISGDFFWEKPLRHTWLSKFLQLA